MRHPMCRRPPITSPMLRPRVPRRITITWPESQRPFAGIKPGTPSTAYTHSEPRAHLTVPVRTRNSHAFRNRRCTPVPYFNRRAASASARPRSPRRHHSEQNRLVGRPAMNDRPQRAHHAPPARTQTTATSPPTTTEHPPPTDRTTPTLPVTPRRVPTLTTLADLQSGSIPPNPFSFETAGREAQTAGVTRRLSP